MAASLTASASPQWKAPAADGKLLIWPEPARLLMDTAENLRRLDQLEAKFQHVPIREIRQKLRAEIGHPLGAPLFATGHQTELCHPGVWAKDALIDAAASKLGGDAIHLAVDTDAPKHLLLRWPGGNAPISDDPAVTSAAWCGLLAKPFPGHLQSIREQIESASRGWSFEPVLPAFLDALAARPASENLSAALTESMRQLDASLGMRGRSLLASPLWNSSAFLLFVHHAMSRAPHFSGDYNAALRNFRLANAMRTTARPMPDLFISDDAIEVPFWLDDLAAGTRSRPSVFPCGGGFVLQLVSGEEFAFDPQAPGWDAAAKLGAWLAANNHRISARALTLTTFVRLCLADQFVHGIGGARYDQVTDRLIARHFNCEPPKFSVTTATMFFPEALGRQRVCLPCVRHEGHRLRHGLLGPRKLELVSRINSLPRRSHQRASAFVAMHEELNLAALAAPALHRWRDRLERTKSQEKAEQAMFDRELFYALQPRDRLLEIIQRYRDELAA